MTHYDIALVGSGSVNSFPGPDLAGRSIVQIDRGVGPDRVFGGTCLNLGCIPTKMFVHTADLARTPAESSRFGGVDEKLETVRWPDIRDRIFGRIDPISQGGGEEYRRDHEDNANLTLLRGTARFTAARTLSVELTDGSVEEVTADVIVLGAGSRPTIPPIDGLADAAPHTSDTIMRVEQLPSSLIILGSGGVVAVEMAHVLSSLGVEVTLVARSSRVLRRADRDVSARLTEILGERIRLETELETTQVRRTAVGIELHGHRSTSPGRGGEDVVLKAEEILVATGRRPQLRPARRRAGGNRCRRRRTSPRRRPSAGPRIEDERWRRGRAEDRGRRVGSCGRRGIHGARRDLGSGGHLQPAPAQARREP